MYISARAVKCILSRKIRFDTDQNELFKVCPIELYYFAKFSLEILTNPGESPGILASPRNSPRIRASPTSPIVSVLILVWIVFSAAIFFVFGFLMCMRKSIGFDVHRINITMFVERKVSKTDVELEYILFGER